MLEDITDAEIAEFIERKQRQWQRLNAPTGTHMIQSGERGTQFVIANNSGEAVIFGQLPHEVFEHVGSPRNSVRRPVPENRKPLNARAIDLTDEQLEAIIQAWVAGRSAVSVVGPRGA